MQDPDQQHVDRLTEVQQARGRDEDLAGITQVGVQLGGRALRAARQQGASVREDDRVVVDVSNQDARTDLVHGMLCGEPTARPASLSRPSTVSATRWTGAYDPTFIRVAGSR